jgi:hypothetical protein
MIPEKAGKTMKKVTGPGKALKGGLPDVPDKTNL